jgi:Fe2+ transport system protein B
MKKLSIKKEHIREIFKSFSNLNVLIIGDVMIDSYMWGKVNRISPEAPVPIIAVNARTGKGIDQLKSSIGIILQTDTVGNDFYNINELAENAIAEVKKLDNTLSNYGAIHYLINHESFQLNQEKQAEIEKIEIKYQFKHKQIIKSF